MRDASKGKLLMWCLQSGVVGVWREGGRAETPPQAILIKPRARWQSHGRATAKAEEDFKTLKHLSHVSSI